MESKEDASDKFQYPIYDARRWGWHDEQERDNVVHDLWTSFAGMRSRRKKKAPPREWELPCIFFMIAICFVPTIKMCPCYTSGTATDCSNHRKEVRTCGSRRWLEEYSTSGALFSSSLLSILGVVTRKESLPKWRNTHNVSLQVDWASKPRLVQMMYAASQLPTVNGSDVRRRWALKAVIAKYFLHLNDFRTKRGTSTIDPMTSSVYSDFLQRVEENKPGRDAVFGSVCYKVLTKMQRFALNDDVKVEAWLDENMPIPREVVQTVNQQQSDPTQSADSQDSFLSGSGYCDGTFSQTDTQRISQWDTLSDVHPRFGTQNVSQPLSATQRISQVLPQLPQTSGLLRNTLNAFNNFWLQSQQISVVAPQFDPTLNSRHGNELQSQSVRCAPVWILSWNSMFNRVLSPDHTVF